MMTKGKLIDLALGKEGARLVDLAIPQEVFNSLSQAARADTAGWYYDPLTARTFGRRLTMIECWAAVVTRIRKGELRVSLLGHENPLFVEWPCFRYHAEQGEIDIEEVVSVDPAVVPNSTNQTT
jgi:hypothetical protein